MDKPKEINIARRLLLSFGILVLIFVLLGLFGFYSIHTVSGLGHKIYSHPLVVSNAALQSNISIMKMNINMKDEQIRQIREEGFPNDDIKPDGDRPEYSSIIFLEPFNWRNQRAFGYDMFSEPTRKEAMVKARDTGLAAVSGQINLLQETSKDVQAGFLIYLPVYRKEEVLYS